MFVKVHCIRASAIGSRVWKSGPQPIYQAVCLWSSVCPQMHLLLIRLKVPYGMAGAQSLSVGFLTNCPRLTAPLLLWAASWQLASREGQLLFSCLLGRAWSITADGRWPVFSSIHFPSQTTLSLLQGKEVLSGKLLAPAGRLSLGC